MIQLAAFVGQLGRPERLGNNRMVMTRDRFTDVVAAATGHPTPDGALA